MKDFFKNIKTLIILILLIIVLFQTNFNPFSKFNIFNKKSQSPIEGSVITKTEIKWDTLKIDSLVYIPQKILDTVLYPVPFDIDTLAILEDYYQKYFYSDVINLDTLGNITINDTVSRNKIISRKILPFLTLPTKTITRDSLINKREFYYGVGLAGNKTQFNYLGGELLYKTKDKHIYGVGVGINQNFQPTFSGRIYWKFGK